MVGRSAARARHIAPTEGVEEHGVDGVIVGMMNVDKTVVDCIKYRNKSGLDVALEALREAWRAKRITSADIWRYGKICHTTNVTRLYLEGLG